MYGAATVQLMICKAMTRTCKRISAGISLLCLLPVAAPAALFEVIHHFDFAGGYNPYYGAPQVIDGKVYGMTSDGGTSNLGVIYRCDLDGGNYEVLKHFGSALLSSDGAGPLGSVIGYDGRLYGMTRDGGSNRLGVIFRCDLDGGNYEVIKHLGTTVNGRAIGVRPVASLVQHEGLLYGLTTEGGTNSVGVLFRCNPDGSGYVVLKDFLGFDGVQPHGDPFIYGGKIYGTSELGGTNGLGVLFRCDLDGGNFEVLKNFGGAEGAQPFGSVLAYEGRLYGMTEAGGADGRGVIFRCDPDGANYTVLRSFRFATGQFPFGSLLLYGTSLYGMTFDGGTHGLGVLFQCGLDGSNYTTLKAFGPSFSNPADGRYPRGSVTVSGGKLYGVTSEGGTNLIDGQHLAGVLFRYSLPPLIAGITPGVGPVGAAVGIVGHGFSEATNVVFGGDSPSDFVVVSDTNLTAIVPDSALTGPIVVRTPHGASTSAVHFVVNHAPIVLSNIADQVGVYGVPLEFTFEAAAFQDEDGDLLSYAASGMPPGINFDSATRTFVGVPGRAGSFLVGLVASDSGAPALSVTNTFSIHIDKAILLTTADDQRRSYGMTNPPLTIRYGPFVGTDGPSDLDAPPVAGTLADVGSPAGLYPITLTAGLDDNYSFNLQEGTLTIAPAAPVLSVEFAPGAEGQPDRIILRASGLEPSSVYHLLVSDDLSQWAPSGEVKVASDGSLEFIDTIPAGSLQRFYRFSSE